MNIQMQYSAIFTFITVILTVCAYYALKSNKPIGKYVFRLELCIIIPVIANILIIGSHKEIISKHSYYLYYIGMTAVMMTLVSFTNKYCQGVGNGDGSRKPTVMYLIGGFDILQLLAGFIFNHVFSLQKVMVDDKIYYKSIPSIGLYIHRIADYILLMCILLIFILSTIQTSKLYREKYTIILITLLISGTIQAFFIFSNLPVDRSVIAHGLTGIAIYYFSIKYRPMRLLNDVLSNIAKNMNDAIFVFDSYNHCIWGNETGYKLLNVPYDKYYLVKDAIKAKFGDLTGQGENWIKDFHVNHRYYTIEKTSLQSENLVDGSYLVIEDNTEQYLNMEKELYNSTHDKLTGLYNINCLYETIHNHLMETADSYYYILYMNIKNFKLINDIFGKKFGDDTIIQIADLLRRIFKKDGIYGRLVGDKFGICIPIEKFDKDYFMERLSSFVVKQGKIEYKVIIHVGVYKVDSPNTDVSIMFDRANLALSTISNTYKTSIQFYDNDIKSNILEEQKLTNDLDEAISNHQIKPYLQPITNINGKTVGAEVLARWIHPVLGFLPPIKFIPIFEKNSIIVNLDKYIWERACQILQSWKGTEYQDLFLSVNISPKDFYFIDVVEEIQGLIRKYDVPPDKLRIEITESAMMSDPEEKEKIFDKLRHSGFIVEMDDFGSGYSSLNLLKDMPVDILKLDMKFLSDDTNKSDTIIKNIINLSNELHMTTLTEGVETKQQFQQLIKMGCSLFQGYYFAKPMPVNEFEKYIKE